MFGEIYQNKINNQEDQKINNYKTSDFVIKSEILYKIEKKEVNKKEVLKLVIPRR